MAKAQPVIIRQPLNLELPNHGLLTTQHRQSFQPALLGDIVGGLHTFEGIFLPQAQALIFAKIVISHKLDTLQIRIFSGNFRNPIEMFGGIIHSWDQGTAQDDGGSLLVEVFQIGKDPIIGNPDQVLMGHSTRGFI